MPPLTHHRSTLSLKVARHWVGLVAGAPHGACELMPPTDRISFNEWCFTFRIRLMGSGGVFFAKKLWCICLGNIG